MPFFRWLAGQLHACGFFDAALRFHSQWGVDLLWCAAAKEYAHEHWAERPRVGCAVIPAAVLSHSAARDVDKRGRDDARRGQSLIDWSRLHMRSWALKEDALVALLNPTRKRQAALRRVEGSRRGAAILDTLRVLTGEAQPTVATSNVSQCVTNYSVRVPGNYEPWNKQFSDSNGASACLANASI